MMSITPGYSGRALWQKLGVKEGFLVCEWRAFEGWREWMEGVPVGVEYGDGLVDGFAFAVAFVRTERDVSDLVSEAPGKIAAEGVLWVGWAKKSSPLVTEVDFDMVQQALLGVGLVDIKVCAMSEDFTGLKFMVRKELRAGWRSG